MAEKAEKPILVGATGRFVRSTLALIMGVLGAKYSDNAWLLSLTPILQTIGKALRDKNPGKFDWFPF